MAKAKSGVGLDIGSNSIKVVELVKTSRGIELKNASIVKIKATDGTPKEENTVSALIEAISSFKKLSKSRLVVAMQGRSVIVRHFKIPSVGANRIKQIIKYEAQQQVPFPLEDVIWDYQILENDDKTTSEINIALLAVKSELIYDLLARISAVGMFADIIEPTSFAVFNCAKFNNMLADEPTVLIDIGATSACIGVAKGRQLVFARSIRVAGNDITRIVQKDRDIGFEDAEKLKLKDGSIGTAVSVLETLSGEIHRSISFYMSQMDRKSKFSKAILTGQASGQKEIAAFLSDNLKLQVVGLTPFSNILISNKAILDITGQSPNAWSVAIGSALTALNESDTKANLLPPEIITEKKLKNKRTSLIISAILSISIFMTVHVFTVQSYAIKSSKLQQVNDMLNKCSSFIPRIEELENERIKIKQRLKISKSVIFKRDLWPRTLMEISRLTTSSIVISQFSSYVEEKDGVLLLVGLADSYPALSNFISRLKSSPYFEDAELVSTKENKITSVVENEGSAERVSVQFELNLISKKE